MKIPAIFQGKVCNCGSPILDKSVKEIGIDYQTQQFLLRFCCPDCGLNGRLLFKTGESRKLEDLCSEIINMKKIAESNDNVEKNDKKSLPTKEEKFCMIFDQNKIGCLFIPEWTNESCHKLLNCYQ